MHVNDAKRSESARHESAVEALAREMRTEPANIRKFYDTALARLEANAKVRSYLTVLAGKNVRSAWREARRAKVR